MTYMDQNSHKHKSAEEQKHLHHDDNVHGHDHKHKHFGHHHHVHAITTDSESLGKVFYWAIGLNLGYVILEAIFGLVSGSMGLLSDAGHNLSDVASLLIALIAFKASQKPPSGRYSYGYGKATIEASLFNAIILYVAVIFICVESIERLIHPRAVEGGLIAIVAGAGVVVNGVTAWMLMRHAKGDLNVRGAFMHMLADTAVSVGVVVSGIVIVFTGWSWLDPVLGLLIAAMIAIGSWSLLRDSLRLALDAVPDNVNLDHIARLINEVEEVESFHHLHVWPLSTTRNALTVHIVVKDPAQIDKAIRAVRSVLSETSITHSTIEAETTDCGCSSCDSNC